jgi:hypothetical protein
MSRASRKSNDPTEDDRVVVESPGPDEWIVGMPTGGRALHIYRMAGGLLFATSGHGHWCQTPRRTTTGHNDLQLLASSHS